MNIEYDEQKASKNLKKHGVSFEEAQEALYYPFVLVIFRHAKRQERKGRL
jgi:uncharacterized DUF497 family protein